MVRFTFNQCTCEKNILTYKLPNKHNKCIYSFKRSFEFLELILRVWIAWIFFLDWSEFLHLDEYVRNRVVRGGEKNVA